MLQENEIIMLILSAGALTAIVTNAHRLVKLPRQKLLISSFVFFTLAALFTNLEGLFWPELLNIVEHFCIMVSSILIAVWCFFAGVNPK